MIVLVEGVLAAWVEIRMGGIVCKEGEEGLERGWGEGGMGE